MIFHNKENKIELIINVDESDLACKDAAQVSVKVSSNGYSGNNIVWIMHEQLLNFYNEMKLLERQRKGVATLNGITEDEIVIKVYSLNNRGHMAVKGKTGYYSYEEDEQFYHSVEFGFQFDPSQLVEAVKEIN